MTLTEYMCDGRTDGRTDGPTDRRTDRVTYRVACTRLKIEKCFLVPVITFSHFRLGPFEETSEIRGACEFLAEIDRESTSDNSTPSGES